MHIKKQFRVWTDNKMIYPHEHNKTCGKYSFICFFPNNEQDKSTDFKIMNAEVGWNPVWKEQIIMQCIGEQDVDGTDIYEGDILEDIAIDSDSIMGEVSFQDGSFGCISPMFKQFFPMDMMRNLNQLKIIGNTCQNPELVDF